VFERATNKKSKEEYEAEIESLEAQIDQLISDIEDDYKPKLADANTALAECKKTQAEKTAERNEENEFYAEDVKNLVEAQRLLDSALTTLKKFYDFLHAKQGKHHYEPEMGTNSKGGGFKKTHIVVRSGAPDYEDRVAELKELCSKETECVGFDTQGWLKNDIGETYQAAGSDLYVKVFDEENKSAIVSSYTFNDSSSALCASSSSFAVSSLIPSIKPNTPASLCPLNSSSIISPSYTGCCNNVALFSSSNTLTYKSLFA
jgi:hypothetical protein